MVKTWRKIWLLAFFLVVSGACFGQQNTINSEGTSALAEQKGVADAKKDFANGIYVQEIYGLRPAWDTEWGKYLKEKYQVTCKGVAGCLVTPEILGHAQGYNATMQKLLKEKYGKDIFQEAECLFRKQAR